MRAFLSIFFICAVLCLAVLVGPFLFEQPGYVFVSFGKYYLEMTLLTMLLFLFGFWAVFKFTLYVFARVLRISSKTRFYFFNKSEQKAQLALRQGMTAFLLQDWKKAEKLLASAGKNSGLKEHKHMFAAVAADANGDYSKVLAHLNALDEDDEETALLKAKLLINKEDWQLAYELIEPLYQSKPKSEAVFSAYLQVLEGKEDWQQLLSMLAQIDKRKCFDADEFDSYADKVMRNAILGCAKQGTFEQAEQLFSQLPGKYKKRPYAFAAHIELLAAKGQLDQAESELVKVLKKGDVRPYLPTLRRIELGKAVNLTQLVQTTLQKDENDPHWLCALAYLSAGRGDWALAAKVMAKSLTQQSELADMQLLAKAYSEIGEHGSAVNIYQKLQKV